MHKRFLTLSRLRIFSFLAIFVIFLFQHVENVLAEVTLLYFRATSQSNGILLEWETSFESNSSGFYIQRSTQPDVGYSNILIFFLSDSETGEGVYYSYLDDQVSQGKAYYYRLEIVDLSGGKEYYGPISVGYMVGTSTATVTATVTQTSSSRTSTPTTIGSIASPTLRPTSTHTAPFLPLKTPTIIPTLTATTTISGTVSSEPSVTPTLEPLPSVEYLFPAPTQTRMVSATPVPQVISTEPLSTSLIPVKPLSTRHLLLIGIILLLWAFLAVYLVILVRKLDESVVYEENGD